MAEIKRIKCETIAQLNKKSDEDQCKVEYYSYKGGPGD